MARMTGQEAAEKWQSRLTGATAEITRGVNRVTEAPGAKAAAKADKMRKGILEALDSGKWAKNVSAVPLSSWKDSMINKGVSRISAGASAAVPKMGQKLDAIFKHQDIIQGELANMPDLSLDENIARATHFMRRMSDFKG